MFVARSVNGSSPSGCGMEHYPPHPGSIPVSYMLGSYIVVMALSLLLDNRIHLTLNFPNTFQLFTQER